MELFKKIVGPYRILAVFFIFTSLSAQTSYDSIVKSIQNISDTAKITVLTDACWKLRSKEPHTAYKCGTLAIEFAKKTNDNIRIAKAYNLLGVVNRNLDNFKEALNNYNTALRYAEEANDTLQIAYSYNNIGGLYRIKGNTRLALEYILKALNYFEKLNNKEGMAFCTVNIGVIYHRQYNYIKALEYLNLTYNLRNKLNDNSGIALALNLIAEVYFDLKNYDLALKYYNEALDIYKKLDDKKGLSAIWGGIAGIYFEKHDYENALKYRKVSLEIALTISYWEGQVNSYNNIAKIYAELGDNSSAKLNFNKAFKIARDLNDINVQIKCYKALSEFYEGIKEYKSALEFKNKYHSLKDSSLKAENISMVSELEAIYKTEKTIKENLILQKNLAEKERERSLYIAAVIIVLIAAGLLFFQSGFRKKANKRLREINSVKDRLFRIISHDLKAPFQVIIGSSEILIDEFNDLSEEEKKRFIKNIAESGKQTYTLLENLLHWSRAQINNLEFNPEIIELKEVVLDSMPLLLKQAEQKNITIELKEIGDIKVFGDPELIKTVLRNLIVNSIKYSASGQKIKVNSGIEGKFCKISIEDFGVGIGEDIKDTIFTANEIKSYAGTMGEKGTGLGLIICKEFIEKNGGKIWFESKDEGGTIFYFTIPLPEK